LNSNRLATSRFVSPAPAAPRALPYAVSKRHSGLFPEIRYRPTPLRRACAFVIDIALIAAVISSSHYAANEIWNAWPTVMNRIWTHATSFHRMLDGCTSIAGLVVFIAYFSVLEHSAGGTLGKLLLGLRVVDVRGIAITWDTAIMRPVAMIYHAAFWILLFNTFDYRRTNGIDRFSKSFVIRVR
jgi:uncharacterized RDD family membrane protein YckC